MGSVLLYIRNTHAANGITYRVEVGFGVAATSDDIEELVAPTNLAAGDTYYESVSNRWHWVRVRVKNQTPGNTASASIWIEAKIQAE